MTVRALSPAEPLWETAAAYAAACSWRAGQSLAKQMRSRSFGEGERVFVALTEENAMAGYCTLTALDCLPEAPYSPYIGFVFVDEAHRGHRLSEQLIDAACAEAACLGHSRVFLVSDHVGLYEKYGFRAVGRYPAPWNAAVMETVFFRHTGRLPDVSGLIGRVVRGTVDRPMGSRHPRHPDLIYPVNYGYVDGVFALDGAEQDVYLLGVDRPVDTFEGRIIAVYHRLDDIEDKWIVVPEGMALSDGEILRRIDFQERFFDGVLCR